MKKSEKQRYEIDPFGRLISIKSGEKSGVPQFRKVIDGVFSIDKNNTLIYHLKNSQGSLTPQQLKLTGNWSLNKEHNLVLILNKENNQHSGDKLTLEAEMINAESDKLEFSVANKGSEGRAYFYILRLAGRWQADEYNRLSFLVAKENFSADTLTLSGAWEVNKQNQIIYTYNKENLITKEKASHIITLKGSWDIMEKYRILYVLNEAMDSGFEFKVSLGRQAKRGLEYEIGIGSIPEKKRLTLFGSWKISERIGLLFEMPSEEGKVQRIVFGAISKLGKNSNLELKLKSDLDEDLGINLELTKDIFKDQGQAFLEALKDGKALAFRAGLGFRW